MSLTSVRRALVERLDEDDRGDRAWWVVTRLHVSTSWLKGIAEYLEHLAGESVFELSPSDYLRLATIIESQASDPGVLLRRHHLLVMYKPLQLLDRVKSNSWDKLFLTDRGRDLARADDIGAVLEETLSAVRFAKTPWFSPNRIKEYSSFDVPVYSAAKRMLKRTQGYIDRNEFDFFLSRVRSLEEVDWAVRLINAYRRLDNLEQEKLHEEVRNRVPGEKSYQNWRDMGPHTFSFFSLGTSMIRTRNRLLLTDRWVRSQSRRHKSTKGPGKAAKQPESKLRIPVPPEDDDLLDPPAAPAKNDGSDAESFVAKVLRSQGWHVVFYTNRRGFGFDLWASKNGRAMLVEVKSSVAQHGAINLTRIEYLAAREHGPNFVLAIVENLKDTSPRLSMLQDPIKTTRVSKDSTTTYRISRKDWLGATTAQEK